MLHHLDVGDGRVKECMTREHPGVMSSDVVVDSVEELADVELPHQSDRGLCEYAI